MSKSKIDPILPALLVLFAYVALFGPTGSSAAGQPQAAAAPDAPEPPESAVFEMKYRGLNVSDYHWGNIISFSGYEAEGAEEDSFVQAVRARVKEYTPVPSVYGRPRWSVVELKDRKPVALYFDANGDGKVSDDERIPPAVSAGSADWFQYAFVTPDFTLHTPDQSEIPFRAMLVGWADNTGRMRYEWGSACVLEGQATLASKPIKLILFSQCGRFTAFGSASYALLPVEQSWEKPFCSYHLSSLIYHKQQFYHLRLSGTHEKGKTVRVVIEKDARPRARLSISLQGKEPLHSRLSSLTRVRSVEDERVYLDDFDPRRPLPEGRYRFQASIEYGVQKDCDWRADFGRGPVFELAAGMTTPTSVGQLTLSIRAVEEKERYSRDAKERSTFAKGTTIYLIAQVQGKAGEVYTGFSQKLRTNYWSPEFVGVKPHVAVLDSGGRSVASADMIQPVGENDGLPWNYEFSWGGPEVKPGRYTIVMTQNTGPLAGALKGELTLTVE